MIGMDIGNEFNAMCLMNKEGEVLGDIPGYTIREKALSIFKDYRNDEKEERV